MPGRAEIVGTARRLVGAAGVLALLSVIGAVFLAVDLADAWAVVVIALPFVVVLLRFAVRRSRALMVIGVLLGALVIPVYALLGVDALWALVSSWRLPALWSAVVGALIIGTAAWVYLRPWWARGRHKHNRRWAAFIAFALVVLPPAGFAAWASWQGDPDELARDFPAVSQLDVIVLRGGSDAPISAPLHRRGWEIRAWTGRVDGDRVRWGIQGAPPAIASDNADHVLLLFVDGGTESLTRARASAAAVPDDPGEVRRWLAVADEATPRSTPTYALLRTTDRARLRSWEAALTDTSDPEARHGGAMELREAGRAVDTTELALKLAVLDPANTENLALAAQHRPALFFDRRERYATPLNVDQLLRSGKMRLCRRGQALRTLCTAVHGSANLHNEATNLAFDPDELGDVRTDGTIYVNVTRSGNDKPNTVYLDYWWYLPDNPTGAAGGALCGAGFVVAGVTCLDHLSDWEGVTVVLDADKPSASPLAVSYGQHDGVTRYTWRAAKRLWNLRDRQRFAEGIDTDMRPLVFVARGTHASYPTSCRAEKCTVGGAPGVKATRPFKENRHNGRKRWSGNLEQDCREVCLEALPKHNAGRDPARWNAFDGRWGSSQCVLGIGILCTSSPPPKSPARQGRYQHPWCAAEAFEFDGRRFMRQRAGCSPRRPSADEILGGERLLALGDSFSSGQGAGDYEPGTSGRGNTCFRSSGAWPQRLARLMRLVPLQSPACSSATVRDVVDGRPDGERERQVSQISRIDGDPGVITITIGGNDARFSKVLADCVTRDCVRIYRKPSGDVLDDLIAELRPRLADAYRAIRRAAPRARVVVVGYPRLFATDESPRPVGNCAAGKQISGREATYLNGRTVALNAAIASAADEAVVNFVDVTNAFAGHELHCDRPSYVNRLSVRPGLFPASFHPNGEGYARLAEFIKVRLPRRR